MMFNVDLGAASGYLLFALIFAAYFLALEAIFLGFSRRASLRGAVLKRLSDRDPGVGAERTDLVKLRQRRSLSPSGDYIMSAIWLNRLIAQSGVKLGVAGFPAILVLLTVGLAVVLLLATGSILALVAGIVVGTCMPILVLMVLRGRRLKKFEQNLPEAMDTLVRSLRAGHPVQAAIRMVVRELPDPIGTEFSIVSDELTYGLDMETAMKNLHRRVGQQDLGLLVAAVGLQGKTGGNLAEIFGKSVERDPRPPAHAPQGQGAVGRGALLRAHPQHPSGRALRPAVGDRAELLRRRVGQRDHQAAAGGGGALDDVRQLRHVSHGEV